MRHQPFLEFPSDCREGHREAFAPSCKRNQFSFQRPLAARWEGAVGQEARRTVRCGPASPRCSRLALCGAQAKAPLRRLRPSTFLVLHFTHEQPVAKFLSTTNSTWLGWSHNPTQTSPRLCVKGLIAGIMPCHTPLTRTDLATKVLMRFEKSQCPMPCSF